MRHLIYLVFALLCVAGCKQITKEDSKNIVVQNERCACKDETSDSGRSCNLYLKSHETDKDAQIESSPLETDSKEGCKDVCDSLMILGKCVAKPK